MLTSLEYLLLLQRSKVEFRVPTWRLTIRNSRSKGADTLSWPLQSLSIYTYMSYTHMHKLQINIFLKYHTEVRPY